MPEKFLKELSSWFTHENLLVLGNFFEMLVYGGIGKVASYIYSERKFPSKIDIVKDVIMILFMLVVFKGIVEFSGVKNEIITTALFAAFVFVGPRYIFTAVDIFIKNFNKK